MRIVDDLTTENLIKQLAYYAIWLLGIIIAAGALGIDPQTAITGLGFTGVALGFALRDVLANFFSGFIRAAVHSAEGVLDEPAPSVRVRELGQDDIIVEARFWTDSRRSDFVVTASLVRRMIVIALKQAGVGLPDPDVRILTMCHADEWRSALGTAEQAAWLDASTIRRSSDKP